KDDVTSHEKVKGACHILQRQCRTIRTEDNDARGALQMITDEALEALSEIAIPLWDEAIARRGFPREEVSRLSGREHQYAVGFHAGAAFQRVAQKRQRHLGGKLRRRLARQ